MVHLRQGRAIVGRALDAEQHTHRHREGGAQAAQQAGEHGVRLVVDQHLIGVVFGDLDHLEGEPGGETQALFVVRSE